MQLLFFSILLFSSLLHAQQQQVNLVKNGNFDSPKVPRNFLADSRAENWKGEQFELCNYGSGLNFGQYIDLQN